MNVDRKKQGTVLPFCLANLWFANDRSIGLGDLIKKLTKALGIQPCERCNQRAKRLNQVLVFSGGASRASRQPGDTQSPTPSTIGTRRFSAASSDACWHFHGPCTGFGRRQCVTAPASQEPDAEIITHCCNGWFQSPWIEVCPGQPARAGCGFCLW